MTVKTFIAVAALSWASTILVCRLFELADENDTLRGDLAESDCQLGAALSELTLTQQSTVGANDIHDYTIG